MAGVPVSRLALPDIAALEAQRVQMEAQSRWARIEAELHLARNREQRGDMPRIPNYEQNRTQFRQGRNMIRIAPPISVRATRFDNDATPSMETISAITLRRDYDPREDRNIIILERDPSTSWLGQDAIDAISSCLTDIADNRDRHQPAICDNHVQQLARAVNEMQGEVDLCQMARDQVWPMFWYYVAGQAMLVDNAYTRETAKAAITEWRGQLNITKKHWKWLCNKPHWYLFKLFIAPGPWDIRWPENILRQREDMGQITTHRALAHYGFIDWLREYFLRPIHNPQNPDGSPNLGHHRIDPREFDYTMRDIIDVCQQAHGPTHQETIDDLRNSDDWAALVRNVRRIEGNAINMDPGAVNFVRGEMGIDMARRDEIANIALGRIGGYGGGGHMAFGFSPSRPDDPEPMEALAPYPKTIELGKHTAILLDDAGKLYDESDTLRHCIFRSYGHRIQRGDYIAYHIEGPGMGKNGATCGIVKHKQEPVTYATRREVFRSKRKISNEVSWRHDQTRGKGNSIPNMDKAMPFIDHIVKLCNEAMPEEVKKDD